MCLFVAFDGFLGMVVRAQDPSLYMLVISSLLAVLKARLPVFELLSTPSLSPSALPILAEHVN